MMDVNLSEPGRWGDQLDKRHVIPQITLSTDMITHTNTRTGTLSLYTPVKNAVASLIYISEYVHLK